MENYVISLQQEIFKDKQWNADQMILLIERGGEGKITKPTEDVYVWKNRKLKVFVVLHSYFFPKQLYESSEVKYFPPAIPAILI